MPLLRECPFCKSGKINHGFDGTNGGIYLHHSKPEGGHCIYYHGNNGKYYKTELELCEAVVFPQLSKYSKADQFWKKARIAKLTGHPRTAKKYFDLWQAENNK